MQESTTASPSSRSTSQPPPVSPDSSVVRNDDSVPHTSDAIPLLPISSSPEPMQRDMVSCVHDDNTDSCYLLIPDGKKKKENGMCTPPLAHRSSLPPPLHSLLHPIVVASYDFPLPLRVSLPEALSNAKLVDSESPRSASAPDS